jgi:diguanylate cyclase (GGDEF)-like protein/PAS domain S-box-containing protein
MYDINLQAKTDKVKALYDITLQDTISFYILKANYIFQSKGIIDAIEAGDNKKLYELMKPIFEGLKNEEDSLQLIHFHTKDAHSFLRMHKPNKFGDDLSFVRPVVRNVNIEKKFMHGFEVGKFNNNVLTYRLVFPIFNKFDEHLGSVEFGVDFLKKIKDTYSMYGELKENEKNDIAIYGGFLFETTKLQHLVDQHSFQEFGRYSLIDPSEFLKQNLNKLPKDIFSHFGTHTHKIENEHYYFVWDGVLAKSFQGDINGAGIYVFNVTDMIYEYDSLVFRSIIITVIMLLVMYLIIGKGLDYFLKKLKESAEKTQELSHWKHEIMSLFNSGNVVIFKVKNDDNWTIEFATSNIKDILDYSQAYVINNKISFRKDLIFEDCLNDFENSIEDAKFQLLEQVSQNPNRMKKRNDSLVWVKSNIILNYNKNNEVDSFLIAINDISHVKNIEYELMIVQNRFELAIESTKDGLWDFDLINKDIYLSPQFLRMGDFDEYEFKKQVKSKSFQAVEELLVHKDDLEKFNARIEANIRHETDFFHIEYRMKTNLLDQDYLWVLTRGKVLFDEETGEASHIIGFNTDISKQKQAEEHLKKLATIDDLTQIANKVKFYEILEREIDRARRYKNVISIIYFDIDFFKHINDNFGHSVGDEVLRNFAKTIKVILRKSDVFARWSGEEFVLLTPETNLENASVLAEKLRILVRKTEFKDIGHITCSFGVTQFNNHDTPESFIERAERSLQLAKEGGRDKVISLKEEG